MADKIIETTDQQNVKPSLENGEEQLWHSRNLQEIPVVEGDVRIVNLSVKVIFVWSDKIVADYDPETDTIIEYTSGYVMEVLPDQSFVYQEQESHHLFNTCLEK
jgi:hypothetical protein